jgi:hypothetical protein
MEIFIIITTILGFGMISLGIMLGMVIVLFMQMRKKMDLERNDFSLFAKPMHFKPSDFPEKKLADVESNRGWNALKTIGIGKMYKPQEEPKRKDGILFKTKTKREVNEEREAQKLPAIATLDIQEIRKGQG